MRRVSQFAWIVAALCVAVDASADREHSTYSRDEDGSLAMFAFVRDLGFVAQRVPNVALVPPNVSALVVVGTLSPTDARDLSAWIANGGAAIYAPAVDDGEKAACKGVDLGALSLGRKRFDAQASSKPEASGLSFADPTCVLDTTRGQVVARKLGQILAIHATLGRGKILVFSDATSLLNGELIGAGQAVLLRRFLHQTLHPKATIAFLQAAADGLWTRLARSGFDLIALHALALLALLYWSCVPRLGAALRSRRRRVFRPFVEHAEALGAAYERTGNGDHLLAVLRDRITAGRSLSSPRDLRIDDDAKREIALGASRDRAVVMRRVRLFGRLSRLLLKKNPKELL